MRSTKCSVRYTENIPKKRKNQLSQMKGKTNFNIVYEYFSKSVWQHMPCHLSITITNFGHATLTLESSSDTIINTLKIFFLAFKKVLFQMAFSFRYRSEQNSPFKISYSFALHIYGAIQMKIKAC